LLKAGAEPRYIIHTVDDACGHSKMIARGLHHTVEVARMSEPNGRA
jgi:hypothetical protein